MSDPSLILHMAVWSLQNILVLENYTLHLFSFILLIYLLLFFSLFKKKKLILHIWQFNRLSDSLSVFLSLLAMHLG